MCMVIKRLVRTVRLRTCRKFMVVARAFNYTINIIQ